ncbi:hypothetical protein BLNAU_21140 [Blattamonas nauphoetae]|uniref:Uncharacterized protein n=1 Tax=Blattamonas nauphoetae TaxID=2049346 RepID=A0ABQ9WWP7_9EUKA|nr:hypothetical protein BLNAU_21140 [Blattamonas nauphoetae]
MRLLPPLLSSNHSAHLCGISWPLPIILDFLTRLFHRNDDPVANSLRDDVRKEMDEAALSSSSPPFILTSELVCRLTDEELLNVVDRIVGLLESDSCLNDDTILRICTFLKKKLKSAYLPELFRKAGRTTERYFHAFQSLLSLHINNFNLHPINSLLIPKPDTLQPTFDEWDDVDLSTIGVLEPLLSPSIDILFKFSFQQSSLHWEDRDDRAEMFITLSELCDCHAIAQCLSRIGFFSRIVGGLLDDNLFNEYKCGLCLFLRQPRDSSNERPARETLRNTAPHFVEEGWQDVLDFLLVQKQDSFEITARIKHVTEMMDHQGANLTIRQPGTERR